MNESHGSGFTPDRRRGDRRSVAATQAGSLVQRSGTATDLPSEDLWDARDVARHLKVSVSWVRQRVSARQIPFVRIGGWMVRFRPNEIRALSMSPSTDKLSPPKEQDRG